MPENNPGVDALFVLKLKDGNPRERLDKIIEGFVSRSRREQFLAKKLLVEEARQMNLMNLTGGLNERELNILNRRFPQNGKSQSQKQCGIDLGGISGGRIRQLETKALRKLRKALYKRLAGQTP